jgi:MYXO-CTERM domain-containing protein
MRALWLVALTGFCVAGAATRAGAEPRKPTHVACVGDSITEGAGASEETKNYPSLLQGLFGNAVQVRNFGRSGATMLSEGFGDLPYNQQVEFTNATEFVENAGADALVSVVIVLGANDSKPHNWEPNGVKNDQQFKADYVELVDHFLGLPTKPVVYVALPLATTGDEPCCEIRGDVIYEQQIPLIKQIAETKRLPIVDLNTDTTDHPEYFGDGVHPNDAGYQVMANLVKKGLEREPSVSLVMPQAPITAGAVSITAEASGDTVDIQSVEFFAGATSLGKVTQAPYVLDWQASAGAHTLTAKATDTTLASKVSAPLAIMVTEPDPATGGIGGANAGAGPSAGASAGGSAGLPAGGSTNAGAGTSTSMNNATSSDDDAGCSCRIPSPSRNGEWLAGLGLAAGLVLLRRRISSFMSLEAAPALSIAIDVRKYPRFQRAARSGACVCTRQKGLRHADAGAALGAGTGACGARSAHQLADRLR